MQDKLGSWSMHAQKLKFKGQSIQKIEWKQTDEWTDATDCFTFPANVVSICGVGLEMK